jgi:hypothetical protein
VWQCVDGDSYRQCVFVTTACVCAHQARSVLTAGARCALDMHASVSLRVVVCRVSTCRSKACPAASGGAFHEHSWSPLVCITPW